MSAEVTVADQPVTRTEPVRKKPRRDWTNALLRTWGILVYIFLFLPIFIVMAFSFNKGRALLAWDGFGVDWYKTLPDNPVIRGAITTSLKAAVGSAIIATILGSLAGIALARRPGKWVIVFMALVFLVLVTPEIVDAIALLIWYVRIKGPFGPDFAGVGGNYGLLRLWIGHAIFSTAVVTLIVRARLAGLDESLEEAGADLYAAPFTRFRQDHAAADDAGRAGRWTAGVQPVAGQHDGSRRSSAWRAPRRGPCTCSARCAASCGRRSPPSRR